MPFKSISASQNRAETTAFLDLQGEDKGGFDNATSDIKLSALENSLAYLGAMYIKQLNDQLAKVDADSGGQLAKSMIASEVKLFGSIYQIDISAAEYASYIDEGVNGWKVAHGSRFQFKKSTRPRGTKFTGTSPFVESLKAYLSREKNIDQIQYNQPINGTKEVKRRQITDATTQGAIRAAYMIKRQGIKPNHFWRDATSAMVPKIKEELGAALKIDIINNITGQKY